MIPADIKLYSWVDVEEVLYRAQLEERWPDNLIWARAYWDGLTLGIRPKTKDSILNWLSEQFDPRFDTQQPALLLESLENKQRFLNIEFEETDESGKQPKFRPTLARPNTLYSSNPSNQIPPLPDDAPPLVIFHSFKGGVGRTLHSLAFALDIVQSTSNIKSDKNRVLLVDADLEAPGLTWLLFSRFPNPSISFADFLTLIHGSTKADFDETLQLIATRIKENSLDGIYLLPSFRAQSQFSNLDVRPEHLIQGADPFILTKALTELGKLLEVSAILVDLRAGLSELSAGLLLDPRVYRVLVTTPSGQSVDGTCQTLQLLQKLSPKRTPENPRPIILISQILADAFPLFQNLDLLEIEEKLTKATFSFDIEKEDIEKEDIEKEDIEKEDIPIIRTDFSQQLFVLPNDWNEVFKRIKQSKLIRQISQLNNLIPLISARPENTRLLEVGDLEQGRKKIRDYTKKLIFAESSDVSEFLSISPLKNLATDFSQKTPIALVVGAKGSGKTYTYLQIAQRQNWSKFVADSKIQPGSTEVLVCPVLKSKNLTETWQNTVQKAQQEIISKLGLSVFNQGSLTTDYLQNGLEQNLHEGQWRDRWLNLIAWNCNFEPGDETAGRRFISFLREQKKHVLAIIDGLEDYFQDLSPASNKATAIRSLLQEVPEWLEQTPQRPLGILIFVRQDMVLNAITQNSAQLMAKYEPYSLKWNSEEALRLVAWVVSYAGIRSFPLEEELHSLGRSELINNLLPLWGRKLGSTKSNEARSAEWVLTALSDLKGQIQARDVVRFLYEAAQESAKDKSGYWKDRYLTPVAIRQAVGKCSDEKIKEIQSENPTLGKIFSRLQQLSDDKRKTPFTSTQVELTPEQIKVLDDNGAIYREGEEYYLPEIFRRGLNFKSKAGQRPRVLSLLRRVTN